MSDIDNTVRELRTKLAQQGVTFLLVYAAPNPLTNTVDTKITSNSSRQGVQAILTYILRPTKDALARLATELEAGARAGAGMTPEALDKVRDDGAFLAAAKLLFEGLRPLLTIVGWEAEQPQPS